MGFQTSALKSVVVAPIRPDERRFDSFWKVAFMWLSDCMIAASTNCHLRQLMSQMQRMASGASKWRSRKVAKWFKKSFISSSCAGFLAGSWSDCLQKGWFQLSTQLSHAFCDGVQSGVLIARQSQGTHGIVEGSTSKTPIRKEKRWYSPKARENKENKLETITT